MILGIDPGSEQSAFVLFVSETEKIHQKGIMDNETLIKTIESSLRYDCVAIENMQNYGAPFGKSLRDTCIVIGRIIQAASAPYFLYPRPTIKAQITGMVRAKDADVSRALKARYGEAKKGHPLEGIKTHLWAALAVAVYHSDVIKLYPVED